MPVSDVKFIGNDGSFYRVYQKGDALCVKTREETSALAKANGLIAVCPSENGFYALFKKDKIYFMRRVFGGDTETKTIAESCNENNTKIFYDGKTVNVVSAKEEGRDYVVSAATANGKLYAKIPNCGALDKKRVFALWQTDVKNVYIFYRRGNDVYYGLISNYKVFKPVLLLKNAANVYNVAFGVNNNVIYAIYAEKVYYGDRIYLLAKEKDGEPKTRLIWDGYPCAKLNIAVCGDDAALSWVSNGSVIFTKAEGLKTEPLKKYKIYAPKNIVTAESYDGFASNSFYANADTGEMFFHDGLLANNVSSNKSKETSKTNKEEIAMLKNRIDILNNENFEKANQIMEFNQTLSEKSGEIVRLNAVFKNKSNLLDKEIAKLKRELELTKRENYRLNDIIEDLLSQREKAE